MTQDEQEREQEARDHFSRFVDATRKVLSTSNEEYRANTEAGKKKQHENPEAA